MIQEVCFAAATDEGRPVLGGVLLVLGEKEDVFVATDGFRLSLKKRKTERDSGSEERKLILPARTLTEISRIIGEKGVELGEDGRVDLGKKAGMSKKGEKESAGSLLALVTKESNQVIFRYGQADIVSRLIDGQFPNFEKIIPTSFSTKAVFDKEDLQKAVKQASVFARDTANIVRFKVLPSSPQKNSCLQVNAGTAQVGETKSEIEAEVEGVENEIAFNLRFLLDLLNNVSYDRLSLEMSGPLSPGVFRPAEDDSYLHIIMPVRLQQ
jgi:DNA polymerase-3 subunit beta